MSQRTTLLLSSSRSYASLAKAILTVNENLYGNERFAEFAADRVEFKDVYESDGSLSHFEIVGTPTDFFQIGLRYGAMEEVKKEKLYAL
jgi:hypothetical protein